MREIQLDFEGFKHWFCYQIEMYNEEWRANGGDAKNHFPFTILLVLDKLGMHYNKEIDEEFGITNVQLKINGRWETVFNYTPLDASLWSQVKPHTPIMVCDNVGDDWMLEKFACFIDGEVYTFDRDIDGDRFLTPWRYAKHEVDSNGD